MINISNDLSLDTGQPARRKTLPDGISIQVTQTRKTYAWRHSAVIGEGDATLNGLINRPKQGANLDPLASPKMKGIGVPSEEEAKAISQNYQNLPGILAKMGFGILDERREAFIRVATRAKAKLASAYGGKSIPYGELQQYDDAVNRYKFSCIEVTIRGFSVTTDNPKGSRKRKSDGKFVTERILRRVCIDKPMNDQQMQKLLDVVTGNLVQSMARAAEYTVEQIQPDRASKSRRYVITLTDSFKTRNGKPVRAGPSGASSPAK